MENFFLKTTHEKFPVDDDDDADEMEKKVLSALRYHWMDYKNFRERKIKLWIKFTEFVS